MNMLKQKIDLIIDVDGVITDSKMVYSSAGKLYKTFGPDDYDALTWLQEEAKKVNVDVNIMFVSADLRGFEISKKRVLDMGFRIEYVKSKDRWKHIKEDFDIDAAYAVYIGDGFVDIDNFKHFGYCICPNDAFYLLKNEADYVTQHNGGHRCVAEACVHIQQKFLESEWII